MRILLITAFLLISSCAYGCSEEGLSPELKKAYEQLKELLKDEPDITVEITCPEEE